MLQILKNFGHCHKVFTDNEEVFVRICTFCVLVYMEKVQDRQDIPLQGFIRTEENGNVIKACTISTVNCHKGLDLAVSKTLVQCSVSSKGFKAPRRKMHFLGAVESESIKTMLN
jgi:hypothetical protein